MLEFFRALMNGDGYAPHGYCLLWRPELIWTSVISDGLIALAYFSIPVALVYFVRKRPDVSFGWAFWAFAAFITACGFSHLMHIWNLWNGDYGAEVAVKALTAIVSVVTAIAVWPLVPKGLAIPSTASLQGANAELALRVAERDAALAQLRHVAAERANAEEQLLRMRKLNALGQLAGGVAHDFNNLLQAVRGNLDLIVRRADDATRVRRYAESGLQAAERGTKLTGQLLAFSRTQKLDVRPVAAVSLVSGMSDMLIRSLGPSVRIRLDLASSRSRVLAEPTQLELAILNLALNARDAMPDGGTLTIASAPYEAAGDPELDDGAYLRIDVADTGAGMDADTAARALEPFFTTKPVGKGTGLGLSMVYGFARQSGGTVRIASAPGAGTTVSLFLREVDGDAGEQEPARPGVRAAPLGNATVLLVDDDGDVRASTANTLDALGYTVVEAAGAESALKLLGGVSPDLALMDYAMPEMNGAELAKAIRERMPRLPIVFASGFADTDALRAAVGPDTPVLRKPFGADELGAVLAAVLQAGMAMPR